MLGPVRAGDSTVAAEGPEGFAVSAADGAQLTVRRSRLTASRALYAGPIGAPPTFRISHSELQGLISASRVTCFGVHDASLAAVACP